MALKDEIQAHHDELHRMLKASGNPDFAGLTIISVNDRPAGQMVIAPPGWSDDQIAARLQSCIDGIKSREVHERT